MYPVRIAVERTFRDQSGAVLAGLIRVLGDFELAEDALHDALTSALERWPVDGIPANPAAWITTAARRKAIDRLRRQQTARSKERTVVALAELEAEERAARAQADPSSIPDDRLRLVFTCCHPSLSREARVALTLRTLGGLTTAEVAAALLVPVPTMAQRLVRAKTKIRDAGVPYSVPDAAALPERLNSVLAVLYLIFNEGYYSSGEPSGIRRELCDDAIRMARALAGLMPEEPEVLGLLALMLLHHSRQHARTEVLEEQDRTRWDATAIDEGCRLTQRALRMGSVGPYQLQAAIAAVHAEAPTFADTDWRQISGLYVELARRHPSPIVQLNRAVAVSMVEGAPAGLELLNRLEGDTSLRTYQPYQAARADLLRRAGRLHEAATAYRSALRSAPNDVSRKFLSRRLHEVESAIPAVDSD